MTDGKSFDSVVAPGRIYRARHIKCYAVGIGHKFNRRQLLQITGGDKRHVLTAGFRSLPSIVRTIGRRACRGTDYNYNYFSWLLLNSKLNIVSQQTLKCMFIVTLTGLSRIFLWLLSVNGQFFFVFVPNRRCKNRFYNYLRHFLYPDHLHTSQTSDWHQPCAVSLQSKNHLNPHHVRYSITGARPVRPVRPVRPPRRGNVYTFNNIQPLYYKWEVSA